MYVGWANLLYVYTYKQKLKYSHGCCYNYKLSRIIVGESTTDWRTKHVIDSAISVEICDIEKNEWILIKDESHYKYRYGNIFYNNNNPFMINICGFGESKYNVPH